MSSLKVAGLFENRGKNIVEVIDDNNHPPYEEKILNRNELKRKATADSSERPTKFIPRN
jgi:hypothetical protein